MWTTDLAGGDRRAYLAGLDEEGIAIREPRLVGSDIALIRDRSGRGGGELWVVSQSRPGRLLMDGVGAFVTSGPAQILAIVDLRTTRTIWRVPLDGASPTSIARLQARDHGPAVGPFGVAVSPDGRTVAAGWVGGPLEVVGPIPSSHNDVGAPLVVDDDGRLLAVTGRAGEGYLVDGDRLDEFAPADSDPLVEPGTGTVAWPTVGEDGALVGVEVRDLITGTIETYRVGGLATNVTELTASHVILEATAFDPLRRTVTVIDRRDGRSTTFEAAAPEAR